MWVEWMGVLSCPVLLFLLINLFIFVKGVGWGSGVCEFSFKRPVLIYNSDQSFYITFALSYLYLPQTNVVP